MASSNPLRLDAELVRAAGAVAKRNKRSVPRQIEHWAELGRALEALVGPTELIAIQEGLARLVVETTASAPLDPAEVFKGLERARSEGDLPSRASSSRVRYQSAAEPGYLEQVRPDGKRTVGKFRSGRFVARKKRR
jgi:hypothetical protein